MAQYVVATNGVDSAGQSGSLANPWLTPAYAHGRAEVTGADTILIRGGTYPEAGTRITKSGITFEGYQEEAALLDSSTTVSSPQRLAIFHSVVPVTIRKLTFQNYTAVSHGAGIHINGVITGSSLIEECRLTTNRYYGVRVYNSNQVVIRNCEIDGNYIGVNIIAGPGLEQTRGAGCQVVDNWIHHNQQMITNTVTPTTDDAGAIAIAIERAAGTASLPIIVSGNLFHHHYAPSFDFGYDGSCVEVFGSDYVQVFGNTSHDNKNFLETGAPVVGGSPLSVDNLLIHHNLVYRGVDIPRTNPNTGADDGFGRGILLAAGTNVGIYNNTLVDLDQFAISIANDVGNAFGGPMSDVSIRNNIIVTSSRRVDWVGYLNGRLLSSIPNLTVDYNLYKPGITNAQLQKYWSGNPGATYTSVAAIVTGTATEDNGVQGDPLFVNTVADDYHLLGTSPAKNVGVVISGITDGYQGAAPDLGAFEVPETTVYAQDTFPVDQTPLWPAATIGGAYTKSAGADSEYAVTTGRGTITISAVSTGRAMRLLSVSALDAEALVKVRVDKVPTPSAGQASWSVALRYVDGNNNYRAYLRLLGSTVLNLVIRRAATSGAADISSVVNTGYTGAAATDYWIRFRARGTNPTNLLARAWPDGQTEPTSWTCSASDFTAGLQVPGAVELRAETNSSPTNLPYVFAFDSLDVAGIPEVAVAAAVSGTCALAGAVAVTRPAAVAVSGVGSLSGAATYTRGAASAVSGVATIAGTPSYTRGAAGALTASGTLTGDPTYTRTVAAAVSGEASVLGDVSLVRGVAASVTGLAVVTGEPDPDTPLAIAVDGALTGTATVTGETTITRAIAGSITGAAVLAGDPAYTRGVAADLSGIASLAGTVALTLPLDAGVSGIASVAGAPVLTVAVDAAVGGTAATLGDIYLTLPVAGSLAGSGELAASAVATHAVEAAVSGTATVTAAADQTSSGRPPRFRHTRPSRPKRG